MIPPSCGAVLFPVYVMEAVVLALPRPTLFGVYFGIDLKDRILIPVISGRFANRTLYGAAPRGRQIFPLAPVGGVCLSLGISLAPVLFGPWMKISGALIASGWKRHPAPVKAPVS